MPKSKLILLLALFFLLGAGLGFISASVSNPAEIKTETKIWRPEDPMINNIFAQVQGKIKEIKDPEILIENQGQTFSFSLVPTTKVFILKTPEPDKAPSPEEGSVSDLKIGKEISVSLMVLADGSFETQIISILPQ